MPVVCIHDADGNHAAYKINDLFSLQGEVATVRTFAVSIPMVLRKEMSAQKPIRGSVRFCADGFVLTL